MANGSEFLDSFNEEQRLDEERKKTSDAESDVDLPREPRSLGKVTSHNGLMDSALRKDRDGDEDARSWIDNPSEVGWRGFLNRLGFRLPPTAEERAHRVKIQRNLDEVQRLNEAIRRPARRAKAKSSFVVVFSEKGGVGKTTTSAILGLAFSQLGHKNVAICELNPDRGTLAIKMGTPEEKNVAHMIEAIKRGEFEGDNRISPKEFMPKTKDYEINVLSGNMRSGVNRYNTSAEDAIRVAKEVAPYWDVAILDNGTGLSDRGLGWDAKSPILGSMAVAHSLVLVANSDAVETESFINSTLKFLEDKASQETRIDVRKKWDKLRRNVILVIMDKEQSARRSVSLPNGKVITGTRGALETYNRFQIGKKVSQTFILPYDPALAASPIPFHKLRAGTLNALRELAAAVWENC